MKQSARATVERICSNPPSTSIVGEHTHPKYNPKYKASTVYLIDRSRASTFHFLVVLCAAASYGVGQENEIATQAGVPAIRLVNSGVSRMMLGSWVKNFDISYTGSLEDGIFFDEDEFVKTFRGVGSSSRIGSTLSIPA